MKENNTQNNKENNFSQYVKFSLVSALHILAILTFVLNFNIVYADSTLNTTLNITFELESATKSMNEMISIGIPVEKYNDTLIIAMQLGESLIMTKKTNDTLAIKPFKTKLTELNDLKKLSYRNLDELNTLKNAIAVSKAAQKDILIGMYNDAENEFMAGRLESSLDKIDMTYNKLLEFEATETKLKILYETTTKSLGKIIYENWLSLLIMIGVIILLVLLMTPHIKRLFISNKIEALNTRAEAIKVMIKESQEEYFDKGAISESMYHTRIRKYGELLRDVHREIPIMKEKYLLQQDFFSKLFSHGGGDYHVKQNEKSNE